MAKKPTVTTVASGYYGRTALNDNFTALRDGFDNTLSLDGSTPNAMGADLDMNSNDVLNVGTIAASDITVAGTGVTGILTTASNAAAAASTSATNAATSETNAATSASEAAASAASIDLVGLTATTAELNVLDGVTATTAELNFVDGVTSNIQTQLDAKAPDNELTQLEVEDDTSTVFGQVSGQRLAQAQRYILLERVDLSGGAVSDVEFTFNEALYDQVVFVVNNINVTVDDRGFRFQTSSDGGVTFDNGASDYRTPSGAAALVDIAPQTGNAAGEDGVCATVSIFAPGLATRRTRITAQGVYTNRSGALVSIDVVAERQAAEIVNGIRFSTAIGQLSVGTIAMYGLRNS